MKKKKEYKHHQTAKKNIPATVKVAEPEGWTNNIALPVILLLSFIVYLPTLHNGFVNWDDDIYILNNNLIKDLSWKGLKAIFNNFSSDNYSPVSDVINAVQYKIGGLSPAVFHIGSLVIHLINVALVFWFIQLLSKNLGLAAITALLFGIHPMQVESVAWASAGSTLFFAAFFLSSLVAYLYYLRQERKGYLLIALLFFVLSLLSKAVAVVLPVLFLLIDYYKSRKITLKVLLEKVPFLMLSIGVGILTLVLKSRNSSAIGDIIVASFSQRLIYACYGFITYLSKLLLPLHLSAFYPYPVKNGADIPFRYYMYVLLFLGLAAYVFYSHRFSKKIIFGVGFFAVTVFLVLQLLPVGSAIMADRYSYIPSIGIFYLAAEGLNLLWSKKSKFLSVTLLSVFAIFFSVKTYARCGAWKNSMALWTDVIKQYQTIDKAYNNRGNIYMNENKYDLALNDYNKAIELNANYAEAYYNRGNAYKNENKYKEASDDYTKAIELKPGYMMAYNNRGVVYMDEKKYDLALVDYNKAIELNPDYTEAYFNRGIVYMNEEKYDQSLADYTKAIELKPDYARAYLNRGTVYMNEKKYDQALNDCIKAIALKPDYPDAFYSRGLIFYNAKRYEEAISDYSKAIELKADYVVAFFSRAVSESYSGKNDDACADMKHAASLGYQPAATAILQICK